MQKNRKAVFFDIDDTIFKPGLGVTKKTKQAIELLNKNGITPVICTGRSRAMIFDSLINVGFTDIVAGAGTYVEVSGKVIYNKDLAVEKVDEIVEAMVKYGFNPIPEGHEYFYYSEECKSEHYREIFDKYYSEMTHVLRPIKKGETIASKVSGQFTEKSDIQSMINMFENEYAIVDHRGYLLELIPLGYSKATGIEKYLEYTGIRREDTYAFGDSMNDKEMIEYVAHGVVMGNGSDELKSIADYVTDTIDNDGVYKGLKYYGLI